MPTFNDKEISSYGVFFGSTPRVTLFERGEPESCFATIWFTDDKSREPYSIETWQDGIHVWYPRATYLEVIDLLRNEGPLTFYWLPGTGGFISARSEPVGEMERPA